MKMEVRRGNGEERLSRTSAKPFFLPSDLRLPPSAFRIFLRYWLPLIAYCLFIIIQSHFPAPKAVPSLPFFDKLLHTAGYALLGLLFCRAYHFRWPQVSSRTLVRASVLSAALFGLSDEIHQYFVPFRSAEALDVLADTVGGFLGALGFLVYSFFVNERSADLRGLTSKMHSDKESLKLGKT
jgi:VanZ family protein